MYRAALAEMTVPYGDTSITQSRKNAFDLGEYGVGLLANSLELGCDCLGEIRYFDAALVNSKGEPYLIKHAVCMHEEVSFMGGHASNGHASNGHASNCKACRIVPHGRESFQD
jgi:Cu2+-containing amine oxidase